MTKESATTLPLTVKEVRAAAKAALNQQRQFRHERLLNIVERMNAGRALENQHWLTRLLRREPLPMLDPETTIKQWKEERLSSFHPALADIQRTQTWWWRRLVQFEELPESDDDVIMQVSINDLDLIEYSSWKKAQS